MMWLVAVCALLGAPPNPGEVDAAFFDRVEKALESNPDYMKQHRGYLAYLEGRPKAAEAEIAYTELLKLPNFRAAVEPFQQALKRDEEACNAFGRYYEALAEDEALRRNVEGLYRCELAQKDAPTAFLEAMIYLHAHPEDAIRFLENPSRSVPATEPLGRVSAYLQGRPELCGELRNGFLAIRNGVKAVTHVYPWWGLAAKRGSPLAERYKTMLEHFAERPLHFQVWHHENLAFAMDAHAREWADYWRVLVGWNPDFGRSYWVYVVRIGNHPEHREALLSRWAERFGPIEAWPPQGEPPTLPPAESGNRGDLAWPNLEEFAPDWGKNTGQLKPPAIVTPKFPEFPKMPSIPSGSPAETTERTTRLRPPAGTPSEKGSSVFPQLPPLPKMPVMPEPARPPKPEEKPAGQAKGS